VHGDNGLAIERVAEGGERHNLVQPLAEALMPRVSQNSTRARECITYIRILADEEVHVIVVGQVFGAGTAATGHKNKA
jgi:hypothetical protein